MTFYIFSDAATSSKLEIAIGAFICLDQDNLQLYAEMTTEILQHKIAAKTIYKKFNSKKSTFSEIKTILMALEVVKSQLNPTSIIEIYTDCQNICDLMGRRKNKLEQNNFVTASGKIHAHAELYKELYSVTKDLHIKFVKVKGHQAKSKLSTWQERIFSVIDKLSRKKLRTILTHL